DLLVAELTKRACILSHTGPPAGSLWPDPIQIGAPSEEDRQSEHDNPGQQTQGQAESETPAPASAGDLLSSRERAEPKGSSRSGSARACQDGNQAGRAPRWRLLGPR